jgi:hypothetical protein
MEMEMEMEMKQRSLVRESFAFFQTPLFFSLSI